MKRAATTAFVLVLAGVIGFAALPRGKPMAPPAPQEISDTDTAQFCGMLLSEHGGPKGQIFLKSSAKPLWFASVRDAIAFLRLPDMPKDVLTVYVNDMGRAQDWARPMPGTWIDAHRAVYVIGSRRQSGMNTAEAVPFGEAAAARRFAAEYGGQVVTFSTIPESYLFPDIGAGS